MWFDGIRQPNTLYVASVSRGKDSTAMLRAIQLVNWPLDAIVSVDTWFDDDTPAELPPLAKFKDEWDANCLDWFGVPVTRMCATQKNGEKQTYCDIFYRGSEKFGIVGFPTPGCRWCTGELKSQAITKSRVLDRVLLPQVDDLQKIKIVYYVGIAADEPNRIAKHIVRPDKVLPLVQIGWDEDLCGLEATYMDMLSPTYSNSFRDGCWFCHNQSVSQLRYLRHKYPELWAKLLVLDDESPFTFKADGHTVHDFDRRFKAEDDGLIYPDERFRWADLEQPQMRWF